MEYAQYKLQAESEDRHWWHRGKRRILVGLVRKLLVPSSGRLVIDVGCGPGGNLASLSGEYACIGIDVAEAAVRFAQSRFPGMRFAIGDSPSALGEAASGAALFILSDVLEHVRDDRALLSEFVASAGAGALFLITVPADKRLWSPHDVSLGHFRRYDRASLEALWRGLPVSLRLISYFNARLYPLAVLFRSISRLRGAAWGRAGTDVGQMPRFLNWIMERTFSGELRTLCRALDSSNARSYRRGVSLVAVLQKWPG